MTENDEKKRLSPPLDADKLLTPGQIAELSKLSKTRESLTRPIEDIDMERSGQLSPSHTPGRKPKR